MPLWSLIILIFSCCSCAAAVVVCWQLASAAIPLRRRINSLEADILDLASKSARTYDLVKSLSQRQALADHRHKRFAGVSSETETGDAPPAGAPKQQLRDYYLKGKSHVEIARMAMNGSEKK